MSMNDRGRFVGIASFVVLTAVGCSSARLGPSDGSVERAETVRELQDQLVDLEAERDRLSIELASARSTDPAASLVAGLPVPVRMVEASGSTVRIDATGAELRLRVRTEDAGRRFLQTAGPATVSAITFDDAGTAVSLGTWEIGSVQWRAGLREGLMGTAYAIDLPIDLPTGFGAGEEVLVRAEVEDPRATSSFRAEFSVPVTRPAEGGSS